MINLTELEREIFSLYFKLYQDHGFPMVESIRVKKKTKDRIGKFVFVEHDGELNFESASLNAGDHCHIEVDSLPYGLYFDIEVENYKVKFLNIFSNGQVSWNGSEIGWKIL